MGQPARVSIMLLVLILATATWSGAETVVFSTGVEPGFENPVFRIDDKGRGKTHSTREILCFLRHNRSLFGGLVRVNTDANAGAMGAAIDRPFMVQHVKSQVRMIHDLEDIFDEPGNAGDGYEYDIHIVQPGSRPGVLEGPARHPIIIISQGRFAGAAGSEDAYDWLATYYAEKGYLVAMPRFLENFFNDPRTGESNNEDILALKDLFGDIAALQVSDTIDYLIKHFGSQVNGTNVTVVGHSNGGYVAQLAAARDLRIRRIAFLSSVFRLYGQWDGKQLSGNNLVVMDSYDTFRYLNLRRSLTRWVRLLVGDGPALHVQRGIANNQQCPPGIPCDWLVDMTPPGPYDLSLDPWKPFTGCGGPCVDKVLTFYNWALYEGPKEDGVKDNPFTDHGFEGDAGRAEALRLLDNFFNAFPID